MCGIVGVITKARNGFAKSSQEMFYQLLYADALRGEDATGVITVHNNTDFGVMKEAVESNYFLPQFIGCDLDKDLFRNGFAVIGHNRKKTVGKNEDANAHPFTIDNTFSMVHNGTLYNHKQLADTAVDSEALATVLKQAMDQEDYKTALEETLGKVYGAYACVWYDQKREEVCFLRNKERPLCFLHTNNNILFGSEAGLLYWIANRNSETKPEIELLPEHTLYQFPVNGGSVVKTPLSPKVPKTTTTTHVFGGTADRSPFRNYVAPVGKGKPTPRGECSKNEFKRLRKAFLQKEVPFRVDDYVEKHYPTNDGHWIVMGVIPHLGVDHMVHGNINITEQGITEKEIDETYIKYTGTISDMVYDNKSKSIRVSISDIQTKVAMSGTVH
jgi:hypothetical protein